MRNKTCIPFTLFKVRNVSVFLLHSPRHLILLPAFKSFQDLYCKWSKQKTARHDVLVACLPTSCSELLVRICANVGWIYSCRGPGAVKAWRPSSITINLGHNSSSMTFFFLIITEYPNSLFVILRNQISRWNLWTLFLFCRIPETTFPIAHA